MEESVIQLIEKAKARLETGRGGQPEEFERQAIAKLEAALAWLE